MRFQRSLQSPLEMGVDGSLVGHLANTCIPIYHTAGNDVHIKRTAPVDVRCKDALLHRTCFAVQGCPRKPSLSPSANPLLVNLLRTPTPFPSVSHALRAMSAPTYTTPQQAAMLTGGVNPLMQKGSKVDLRLSGCQLLSATVLPPEPLRSCSAATRQDGLGRDQSHRANT